MLLLLGLLLLVAPAGMVARVIRGSNSVHANLQR
jgi:hypothetical protein